MAQTVRSDQEGSDATKVVEPPIHHVNQRVEGWLVKVDQRLLRAPHQDLGHTTLNLLRARLAYIATCVAADRLPALRKVTICLELRHPGIRTMCYHPSVRWLQDHGHPALLAKMVHIPDARTFVSARHQMTQPSCVLHELAHAYHDQVLGDDDPRILAAWRHYLASGVGASVRHVNGRELPHYALSNHKEFFAEMTECYLGINDFFPFNHGELKSALPEVYDLLRAIWGETPLQ